jgi:integrase
MRRRGVEGSVRLIPGLRGSWQARLPSRLDAYRRPLPRTYPTEAEARRALQRAIVDVDRNPSMRPFGRPTGKVRRVSDVLEDYIVARATSALAPLAVRTVRNYRGVLTNQVCRRRANIGRVPVAKVTARDIRRWMEDLAGNGVNPGSIANARRVLQASLAWEVREGRLASNPADQVRVETSKARRAAMQTADPVLLPSWSEFAALVEAPDDERDRLLIAILGWSGMRWSEAISLDERAVWRDRPLVTIDRVLVRRTRNEVASAVCVGQGSTGNPYWKQEPPKSGLTATVPLPSPLWRRLVMLADRRRESEPLAAPAGRLLFRRPTCVGDRTFGIGMLDNTNFRRDVWIPARKAARLDGDLALPPLDPRRLPIKVKDLRAFAASVLLDSGSSLTEAALLLRHATTKTTERHYARAMQERAHDRARREARIDPAASLPERLDALWQAWMETHPTVTPQLGMNWENVAELRPPDARPRVAHL